MMYLMICRWEDDVRCSTYRTKEAVLEAISEMVGVEFETVEFLPRQTAGNIDLEEFPSRTAYIFKAESVVPKPKQVVTEYDL